MQLSDAQYAATNRDNRQFTDLGGQTFADFLQEQILDVLEKSAAGITADARDVNGVALPGVVATRDTTAADGSTLAFAWRTFRFHNGKSLVTVAGSSLTLAASSTNYVEVDRSGTVSSNTTAFTAGRLPLFEVVTGASSYLDSGVTGRATMYVLIGTGGVDGSMGSAAMATKHVTFGGDVTVSATTAVPFKIPVPPTIAAGSKLTGASLWVHDTLAANDTNYWDFGLVNKQTGAGSQTLVDRTAAANSTKVTGGSGLTANTRRQLTLVTLSVGTERDVTGGHLIEFTVTKNGAPANLQGLTLLLEFSFTN